MRFPLWLGGALAALFLLNAAAAVSVLRPPQFATVLDSSQMFPDSDSAWTTPVRLGNVAFKVEADDAPSARSSLRLFEGRTELKPAHAAHADIREKGQGRFSHWGEWLYFSTSDGTDPRSNGRTYSVSATATLDTGLLVALGLLDLICFAAVRPLLIGRYGASAEGASPVSIPILSPLALAMLVIAAAFGVAWFCGLTYRTNDDPNMRAVAEGLVGDGRASEFLIYMNILAGLLLRVLYGVAPHVPWYDLVLAAGTSAGALMLLTALFRLVGSRRETIFVALLGLIVFAGVFQNIQFSAAAILLAGGAAALLASVAFRPPVSPMRLRLCVAAAAIAFVGGSLFRFEAAVLAAALVAPILLLATRKPVMALRMSLAGLAVGIVLAISGKAFEVAYYRFTPGWENFQAEKRARLRVSEYLHADLSREREMNAALAAVEWSRNDFNLITNWMFAVPDTFSADRVARFAELAPTKSWTERIADFHRALAPGTHVIWLFAALCVLALLLVRSRHALAVMLVSSAGLAVAMAALSVAFKPAFLHILWVLCGTVCLVAVATAFAGAASIRRQGYRLIEDRVLAAGVLATLGCVALWQLSEMWASGRTDDDLRARLARDLGAWPAAANTTIVAWDADFPFETWVRPFRALSPQRRQFFHTVHTTVTPLAEPVYAAWGSKDTLWALCHVPQTYLVDARRGYTTRHARLLATYMREHHAEDVTLTQAFDGEATALLACRAAAKGG